MKTFDYSFLDKHVDSTNLGQHDNDNSFLFKDCLLDQFAAWESTHPWCIPIGICPEAKNHSADKIYEFIAMVYEDETGNRYYVHVPDSWPAEREAAERRDWAGMKEAQHTFHEKKREALRKQEETNRQVMSPPSVNDAKSDLETAYVIIVSGNASNEPWAARMYATEKEARKAAFAYIKNWARKDGKEVVVYENEYAYQNAADINRQGVCAAIKEDLVLLPHDIDFCEEEEYILQLFVERVPVPKGWALHKIAN